jgi:hypothetical protein
LGRLAIWFCAIAVVYSAMQATAADAAKRKTAGTKAASAASSKGVPTIDLQTRCKRSEKIMADMMGSPTLLQTNGFDLCMRAEQEARSALVAAWPDVPPSYKAFCIRPAAYSPSYIEWIACMEMLIDLRKLRAAKP